MITILDQIKYLPEKGLNGIHNALYRKFVANILAKAKTVNTNQTTVIITVTGTVPTKNSTVQINTIITCDDPAIFEAVRLAIS